MDSSTMKGTVQGYFDRAFDEMTDKELGNPARQQRPGCESQTGPEFGDVRPVPQVSYLDYGEAGSPTRRTLAPICSTSPPPLCSHFM